MIEINPTTGHIWLDDGITSRDMTANRQFIKQTDGLYTEMTTQKLHGASIGGPLDSVWDTDKKDWL